MKFSSSLNLAALPLALAAVFPAYSQSSLAPVVVTATRFADQADALPLGVSVITADEIRASGVATVNEAIMRVLGVVGRQDLYGGGEFALDLRGFGETAGSNQVLVVDGVRVSEADLSVARLSGIPIGSVEKIEVLRGSGAVLYGEGATGGVIIVTTKGGVGKERKNSASVYAGAGSFGLREARANATLASGGFSLDVSAMKMDSDNHRENFRSQTNGGAISGQWSGDSLRLGLRHAQDTTDSRLPGALTAAEYAQDPHKSYTLDDWARIHSLRNGVFAEADVGEWLLRLDTGTRSKTLDSVTTYRAYSSTSPYGYEVQAKQQSLSALNETRWGQQLLNRFQLGVDHGDWERRDSYSGVAQQRTQALYLKDDLTLAGRTRLSAGWRTESLDKSNSGATSGLSDRLEAWELGLSQAFGALTGYGRMGNSFRLPNVDEFGFTSPGVALVPQTSRDLEAGARWKHAQGKLETRWYRSQLSNEIGYDPSAPGPWGAGANVNFEASQRQGLELEVTHSLSSTLGLRANLAWRDSSFRAGAYAGKSVPLAPSQTASLRADWVPLAAHRLSAGLSWITGQYADFKNEYRMPSYLVADLRYAHLWRNAEFSLGVKNLFDRKYYTQAGVDSVLGYMVYPEAGRAVTAAARVQF
jgi:iron complex outermembrane recepter protein